MSYGAIFIPPERRADSDLGKVYRQLRDDDIRSKIHAPSLEMNRIAQRLGQRYNSGSDSDTIVKQIKKLERMKLNEKSKFETEDDAPMNDGHSRFSSATRTAVEATQSSASESHRINLPRFVPNPLRPTATIDLDKKSAGGQFHVPIVAEPFEEAIQNAPSSSAFNLNTPKMWPPEAAAPSTSTRTLTSTGASIINATSTSSNNLGAAATHQHQHQIHAVGSNDDDRLFSYSTPYDAQLRQFAGTESFGHNSYATTRKREIFDRTSGRLPVSPTISSRPCSRSEPIVVPLAAPGSALVVAEEGVENANNDATTGSNNAVRIAADAPSTHLAYLAATARHQQQKLHVKEQLRATEGKTSLQLARGKSTATSTNANATTGTSTSSARTGRRRDFSASYFDDQHGQQRASKKSTSNVAKQKSSGDRGSKEAETQDYRQQHQQQQHHHQDQQQHNKGSLSGSSASSSTAMHHSSDVNRAAVADVHTNRIPFSTFAASTAPTATNTSATAALSASAAAPHRNSPQQRLQRADSNTSFASSAAASHASHVTQASHATHSSNASSMKELNKLTALQHTLVHCGKLNLAEQVSSSPQKDQLHRGIEWQRMKMVDHARWLKAGHEQSAAASEHYITGSSSSHADHPNSSQVAEGSTITFPTSKSGENNHHHQSSMLNASVNEFYQSQYREIRKNALHISPTRLQKSRTLNYAKTLHRASSSPSSLSGAAGRRTRLTAGGRGEEEENEEDEEEGSRDDREYEEYGVLGEAGFEQSLSLTLHSADAAGTGTDISGIRKAKNAAASRGRGGGSKYKGKGQGGSAGRNATMSASRTTPAGGKKTTKGSTASHSTSHRQHAGTVGGMDSNMHIPSISNSENPFRQSVLKDKSYTERTIPRQPNDLDPLDYKDEMSIRMLGGYNACVKPNINIGKAPSQSDVNETLLTLTRKALLSYNTRTIECGAALKALKDPRHLTPGLQAILHLHQAFVNAAAANPNNWLLNRRQCKEVMLAHVPWMPPDSVHRLLLSFDTQNTGMIRYVRISVTLLCCSEPAMTELASSLNRAAANIQLTAQNADLHDAYGELIVISFIHSFYEECGGGSVLRLKKKDKSKIMAKIAKTSNSSLASDPFSQEQFLKKVAGGGVEEEERNKKKASFGVAASDLEAEDDRIGAGMRLQDFVEAFSCCASSIDDELLIQREARPVLQYLFELHQKDDLVTGAYLREQQELHETTQRSQTLQELSAERGRQALVLASSAAGTGTTSATGSARVGTSSSSAHANNSNNNSNNDGATPGSMAIVPYHSSADTASVRSGNSHSSSSSIGGSRIGASIGGASADEQSLRSDFTLPGQPSRKLRYTYRNGEHSISKPGNAGGGLSGNLLKKPLRRGGADKASMEELINNPRQWKTHVPAARRHELQQQHLQKQLYGESGNPYHVDTSTAVHQQHDNKSADHDAHLLQEWNDSFQASSSAVLLPGGDSVAWTHAPSISSPLHASHNHATAASTHTHSHTANQHPHYQNHHHHHNQHGISAGAVDVTHILKHGGLAEVKALPRFSQEDLINAMKTHTRFLKVFIAQMRQLRKAALPYIFFGSVSIEDSIKQFNETSNSLMQDL